MARAGGLVCRKTKLKNFYDPETAGGCGVAPFWSATRLFCRAAAAPACQRAHDRFGVLRAVGWCSEALIARSGAYGEKA